MCMADDWYSRLVSAIRADGRDMRALSLAAKCGPNYIQQMIKDGKRPTVDKLMSILDVLGEAKTFEILTGAQLTAEDLEFVRLTSSLDGDAKRAALSFFQALQAKQDSSGPQSGSQD